MSNIPAGAWKRHEGYTWPNDMPRWRVTPRRSMHFTGLIWRVRRGGRLILSALTLEMAMGFIGRYERGELRHTERWLEGQPK